jgi:iron complex outermembrane receptor protein
MLGSANTDWQDEIFRNSISHAHHLSGSGSLLGGTLPFRAAINHENEQGAMITSFYKQTTGLLHLTPSLFEDHLQLGLEVRGQLVTTNPLSYGEEAFINATTFDPT